MSTLRGRVALITGAAGGLGSAIARRFAAQGAHVVVTDLDEAKGSLLAESLEQASFQRLDVTQEADWARAFALSARGPGAIDILVNNAGFYQPNIALQDMELATWRRHFAINSDGTFLGCRQALRDMHGRGGSVLNIASTAALQGFTLGAAYCASKAAVLMITRLAARAGGPAGIRVNAILPGAVPTDMLWGNLLPGQTEAEFLEIKRTQHPLGRLASPEDIAAAAEFLSSGACGVITGAMLPVDAGAMA